MSGFFLPPAFSYDGDVDYMAPYLTVDPETGKLITVDPRAEAKAKHQAMADGQGQGNATTQAQSGTGGTSAAQSAPVMGQTGAGTAAETGRQNDAASGPNIAMITGAAIILILAGFAFFSLRKKANAGSKPDSGNG